jgi:hypothetical protein
MTLYQHIPSSVLALEYLADVERFQGLTRSSPWEQVRPAIADSADNGLGRNLLDAYGQDAALAYFRSLLQLNAQRRSKPKPTPYRVNVTHAVTATVPKVEKPKPKPKRVDRLHNERRMRDAILEAVKANGWTGKGERELARLANMPRRTARGVLDRMEADGQIVVAPWQRGRARGRDGVRIVREHPAWSDPKGSPLGDFARLSGRG